MDYIIEGQPMSCSSYEAEKRRYKKVIGKSGRVWLYAIQDNPADNIYVSGGENSDGFGGRTLSFTLEDGTNVVEGEESEPIEGTLVKFTSNVGELTTFTISVYAAGSDEDAIRPGAEFVDPVFGSFKLDFAGLNIPTDSTTAREDISIGTVGEDAMDVTFTNHAGYTQTIEFARNASEVGTELQHDDEGHNITVFEDQTTKVGEYLVVGNEEEGYLLEVSQISNATTGYSNDKVKFKDVFSGKTYEATLTNDGVGSVTIGGKVYNLNYFGNNGAAAETMYVKVNYPDSPEATSAVIWPTIQTSKGAKLMFYEPVTINLGDFDGDGNSLTTNLHIPDGDGYQTIDIDYVATSYEINGGANWTFDSSNAYAFQNTSTSNSIAIDLTTSGLTVNFTNSATPNETTVYLVDPEDDANIIGPALVIIEEKDSSSTYNSLIVLLDYEGSSTKAMGLDEVVRTWGVDSSTWEKTLNSDSDLTEEIDLYGALIHTNADDMRRSIFCSTFSSEVFFIIFIFNGREK